MSSKPIPVSGSVSPRPSPRRDPAGAELSQTPPARLRSASRTDASTSTPGTPSTPSTPPTPSTPEAQRAIPSGKPKFSPWLRLSSRKDRVGKAGDTQTPPEKTLEKTPEKTPTSPGTGRSRVHSSPSRFGAHHTRPGACSNSSNSSAVGEASVPLELPWYRDLGEAGRKMEQAGQRIKIHPVLLAFDDCLPIQFMALGQDPDHRRKSPRYLLGATLLAPMASNGPLTAEEFRSRLEIGIKEAQPDGALLNMLIDTMETPNAHSDSYPADYHRATNIIRLVRCILNQDKKPVEERAESKALIEKEIRILVNLMWPPEKQNKAQERHKSLNSPARVREAKARYPDTALQTPPSPRLAKPPREKDRT